jgi:type II secretory pathway pseudopilin PulG
MTGYRGYQKMRTIINQWLTRARLWVQHERGLGLVESIIAVAIVGAAVVSFVVAMSSGTIAVREGEQGMVAQSLAQTQLEYVKSYPYDSGATTYPTVDTPEGYTTSVGVASIPGTDTDIQEIMVTISRDGEDILTVEDYKVNR